MLKRYWWRWLLGIGLLVGICWPAYTWSQANIKTLKNTGGRGWHQLLWSPDRVRHRTGLIV